MIDLSAAGLSPTETKCYTALLVKADWKPSDLAKTVNETRTNCYKILDKLVGLGLAERFDKAKKLHYRATNPSRLFELGREQRMQYENSEKQLELNAQELITEYVKVHEQPGVSYYQGQAEIGKIFDMISHSKTDVDFVHTRSGDDFYGEKTMHNLRMLAVNNKVARRALTPDTEIATSDYKTFDPTVLLKRTWLRQRDYSAPVEWGAFEDKLYIISYGQEALGIVIQSQPIADAFRQLFRLMEAGQQSQPWYNTLPRHASIPGINTPYL
jgi:DNA-binding MarR family transcriptional regulator